LRNLGDAADGETRRQDARPLNRVAVSALLVPSVQMMLLRTTDQTRLEPEYQS